MSALVLVRHAQASFLEDDYDRLSVHGERQAVQLGKHWAAVNGSFDTVLCGPRRRHRRTAELVGQSLRDAGHHWPEPVAFAEWDEHQIDRLMMQHAPRLAEEHPQLRPLVAEAKSEGARGERARNLQRLFEAVAHLWLTDAVAQPDIETWAAFRNRIHRALDAIVTQAGRGRRVAVFTSGGAVMVALQRAVGCDDQTALATGWRVWNCSLTEFAFSGNRFTLDSFNTLPHLPDPRDWTYR